jgi:hypothetical protein
MDGNSSRVRTVEITAKAPHANSMGCGPGRMSSTASRPARTTAYAVVPV